MILTVTLNAAIDVTYTVAEMRTHTSHQVRQVAHRAGGKGINVARVLHQLGRPVVVTGFAGGAGGRAIRDDLDAAGIAHDLVDPGHGTARQTVTVVDEAGGDATVFLEPGPQLTAADWAQFLDVYDRLCAEAGVVVLSGSVPPGLPIEAYAQLCARTEVPCLVDAGGASLSAAAAAGADALFPNAVELEEATGESDPAAGARRLLEAGAGGVVVSLGASGLLAATTLGEWRAPATERLRGNPTGAGDALVAAVAATWSQPWPERLRSALAWSASAVPMPLAGEVDPPTLDRVHRAAVVHPMEKTDASRPHR